MEIIFDFFIIGSEDASELLELVFSYTSFGASVSLRTQKKVNLCKIMVENSVEEALEQLCRKLIAASEAIREPACIIVSRGPGYNVSYDSSKEAISPEEMIRTIIKGAPRMVTQAQRDEYKRLKAEEYRRAHAVYDAEDIIIIHVPTVV